MSTGPGVKTRGAFSIPDDQPAALAYACERIDDAIKVVVSTASAGTARRIAAE